MPRRKARYDIREHGGFVCFQINWHSPWSVCLCRRVPSFKAVNMQGVVILFFALIAWGSSLSWGACYTNNPCSYTSCGSIQQSGSGALISCVYGTGCTGAYAAERCSEKASGYCGSCPSGLIQVSNGYIGGLYNANLNTEYCTNSNSGCGGSSFYDRTNCWPSFFCTTKNEADSLVCVNEGNVWQNGQCQGPLDSTSCAPYKQECEQNGGKFTGHVVSTAVSPTGCLSFCNMCNSKAQENYRRTIALICCRKGMVPPGEVTYCDNLESAGSPDMSFSSFDCDYRGGYDCECETLDGENVETFNAICNDDEWPEPDDDSSDSGGGESSSSEGDAPPGSSGDDWEYDYRDSLHKIIKYDSLQLAATDGILGCLLTPVNCEGLKFPDSIKTPVFAFDTAFRKYLQPLLDSSLKLDSNQLKALLKLDTNQLKLMVLDSQTLRNDTNSWRVFEGVGNDIDTSIHSMNDTTRKWFKRIADSIGVSTDSLAAHIDSIIRHIPDTILDSIVKYQQYATDNFDSVLYGTGKGFSLVDSLIDSVVSYFKIAGRYDSLYRVMFGDSLAMIHGEIIDLPGRNASAIGSALGYGDTATSNLRGDLNGIREAIEGLGDTNGLGGHGGVYGDSLGRYRDSINKYYISDERFGELVDSTEAAWGVDSLDARWDSSYAYGLCNGDDCPPCSDDSCMGSLPANFVQKADSIARIAGDSLEASTKRQRDSLPTFWDSTFKELKEYSWFGSFDSTFLANIGAKIPNSNTCPEHCFAMDLNGTYAYVGYNMHLDWKLCRPIAPNVLNSLNAFDILKLLARVLTVVTCLSILMWEVSSRRGGGIGL